MTYSGSRSLEYKMEGSSSLGFPNVNRRPLLLTYHSVKYMVRIILESAIRVTRLCFKCGRSSYFIKDCPFMEND